MGLSAVYWFLCLWFWNSMHRHPRKIQCSILMEQRALKNVNNCLNTNIYSYLETSGGQSFNLYLNVVYFLTPVLIRHLWQLSTVVFLHWYLICMALLFMPLPLLNCGTGCHIITWLFYYASFLQHKKTQ